MPITVIQPSRGLSRLGLSQLWAHRDLLLLFTLRDIKVRYKQAALGISWAVIQPIGMSIIFFLFFGKLMGLEEKVAPTPYLIFTMAGILPWALFESAVSASSSSVVSNANIIRKVYFPRLIVPLAATGAPLIDYAIGMGILLIAMIFLGTTTNSSAILLPLMVGSLMLSVLGVGILMSAITVAYRDFRHALPFLMKVFMFLTPVFYPITIVPEQYRWMLALNPVGGTISAMRSAMLGTPIDTSAWLISTLVSAVALAAGLIYFQRVERRFADII